MTTRVTFICSNKALAGELLSTSAAGKGDVTLTAHVGSARTLLSVLQKEQPDVVMLDFPVSDELALQQIESAVLMSPGIPVVLVSPDASLEFLKRAMRAGVCDILPSPILGAMVQLAVGYVVERKSITSRFTEREGNTLAFVPVKGGAGATFLATNLAFSLAAIGRRVLVLDLNLYFGNASVYISDKPAAMSLVDLAKQIERLDIDLLDSSVLKVRDNLHILVAPPLPYEIEVVTPDALGAILALARRQYDFVILDVSRNLSPASIAALDQADQIYVTVQLSLPAVQDAKRLLTVFEGLGYGADKLKLVVNRLEKNGAIRIDQLERATQMKVHNTLVDSHEAVAASVNQGVPVVRLFPKDAVSRALQEWALALSPVSVKAASKSWFKGLTSQS